MLCTKIVILKETGEQYFVSNEWRTVCDRDVSYTENRIKQPGQRMSTYLGQL